jgi:hypothetical protein
MTGGNESAVRTIPECLVDGSQVHVLVKKWEILTISSDGENRRINHNQKNDKNRKGTFTIWDLWWLNQFSLVSVCLFVRWGKVIKSLIPYQLIGAIKIMISYCPRPPCLSKNTLDNAPNSPQYFADIVEVIYWIKTER